MERSELAGQYYNDDHALLYGLLGKYAEKLCGEAGYAALEKGTILYARERGLRMAQRCLRDGRELTMRNFLIYSEMVDTRRVNDSRTTAIVPKYLNSVYKCAWNETWQKYGLGRYGAVYCSYADQNIVRGFHPELQVILTDVITHGAPTCEFEWAGTEFADEQEFRDLMSIKYGMLDRIMKDYLYHTGHVLSALRRSFQLELGIVNAEKICAAALEEYETIHGSEKRAAVELEAKQNFLEV